MIVSFKLLAEVAAKIKIFILCAYKNTYMYIKKKKKAISKNTSTTCCKSSKRMMHGEKKKETVVKLFALHS